MMVTLAIRESLERGQIIYEVWRRNHETGSECLLAEADDRSQAREILRHYASLEKDDTRSQLVAAAERLATDANRMEDV